VREPSSVAARGAASDRQNERSPRADPDEPTELDQIGVLIVEEQLGLTATDMAGLRAMAARLPFEPCMSLLASLAGASRSDGPAGRAAGARRKLSSDRVSSCSLSARMARDAKATIFGPQPLYILMRIMIDEARDAPITQETHAQREGGSDASGRGVELGHGEWTDPAVGPTSKDLLGYELQIGHYYFAPAVDRGDDTRSGALPPSHRGRGATEVTRRVPWTTGLAATGSPPKSSGRSVSD